jgi:WD40 repeat protein
VTQNVEPVDESPRPGVSAFISYSRKDVRLAERLLSDLESSGVNAYLDRHDIAPGEAWRDRLGHLIAASDAVVFVISPDSAASDICRWEVAQAHSLGKRLLPLVGRDPSSQPVPDLLSARNWIFCRTDAEYTVALAQLSAAILQDIDAVREQTRLSQLAHGWASKSRLAAELLRGDALVAAERWQQVAHGQGILVGERLVEFIRTSREAFDADEAARTKLVSSAFRAQSDYLGVRSAELLAAGDPVSSLCLAIESAPDRGARLEESRARPFTHRSLVALSEARRHFTTFAFLPPDHRNVEALHAAPDGSAFCGVRGSELMLFAGSAPFEMLARRDVPSAVRDIAFSGESNRLAALLADCSAQVFEREGFNPKLKTDPWIGASGVALDWSGETLVLERADALRAWSVSDGEVFCVQATVQDATGAGALLAPFRYGSTIAPDANVAIVSIGGEDLRCLDWSPATGRWLALERGQLSLRTFRNEVLPPALAWPPELEAVQAQFSADGSTLVIAARRSGQYQWLIFAPVDGQLISTITSGEPYAPRSRGPVCALSDDGAVLVSVSGVQLSRWDTRTGKLLQEKRLPAPLNPWVARPEFALRPSPQGDLVAVLLDPDKKTQAHQVVVLQFESTAFDALDARSPFSAEGAYGFVWSACERRWFAAFGHSADVVVVAASDARLTQTLKHGGSLIDDGVRWAVFGPEGRTLLTCSCDRTARLWDVTSGVRLATYAHPSGVLRAAFSCDGAFVVTLDDAATLRVFPVGGHEAIAEVPLPGAREIAVTANDVVVQTDRLLVLPGLLDAGRIVEVCCGLLPRDLTAQERMQLDLPTDSPECMLRYRKWPALLGQSFAGVTSLGGAVGVVRTATVEPAKHAFRGILGRHGRADIRQLVALGNFVWTHYAGAMGALCRRHNLTNNNEDFELAGEIFDALLEVAEEYRAPDLPLAMITAYRGPAASGSCFNKWLEASRRRRPRSRSRRR